MRPPLVLTREQILGHRRAAGHLDRRIPFGADALRRAAIAGLQDSMPRAALLSLHARVAGLPPTVLDDPALVQVWGPGYSTYVVAASDHLPFTLGRLPPDGPRRDRAHDTADRLDAFLAGRRMPYGEAGHAMSVGPNSLRYATLTGRVLIRWDGARQPTVWMVGPPTMDEDDARRELVRRHLHVQGPATPDSFATWAGVHGRVAKAAFDELVRELVPVRGPIGDAWILASDDASFQVGHPMPSGVRLLPSGDAFWLLHGPERAFLVPGEARRRALWTPRVWPGCLLIDGEPAGTWRRSEAVVTVEPWRALSGAERVAAEAEAASLPLPGLVGRIEVRWSI